MGAPCFGKALLAFCRDPCPARLTGQHEPGNILANSLIGIRHYSWRCRGGASGVHGLYARPSTSAIRSRCGANGAPHLSGYILACPGAIMFSATTISDLLFSSPLETPQTVELVPDEVVSLIYRATARKQDGDLAGTLADLDRALELTAPE